jgi:hypothetical protein
MFNLQLDLSSYITCFHVLELLLFIAVIITYGIYLSYMLVLFGISIFNIFKYYGSMSLISLNLQQFVVSTLLLCMTRSSGLRLPGSSSFILVVARGHALLGKSSGGPSSGPWSVSTLTPEVILGRVVIASLTRGWPRASFDCFSRQSWPWASRNCVSYSRLASGEPEQCLTSEVGLG